MEIDDLQLELFDSIVETKNSMDIKSIKYETDTIYDKYKRKNTVDGKVIYPLLEDDIAISIASYYYNSDMKLNKRLVVIDGMIYFSDFYASYEETMDNLDIKNQLTLALMSFEANKEKYNLNSEDEHSFKQGLAIAAKLNSKYKEK